ncbi:hypothetical protein MMC27_003897 [Xylographa pallens]|nr:hypothetical protein [Xylographa pallens]
MDFDVLQVTDLEDMAQMVGVDLPGGGPRPAQLSIQGNGEIPPSRHRDLDAQSVLGQERHMVRQPGHAPFHVVGSQKQRGSGVLHIGPFGMPLEAIQKGKHIGHEFHAQQSYRLRLVIRRDHNDSVIVVWYNSG